MCGFTIYQTQLSGLTPDNLLKIKENFKQSYENIKHRGSDEYAFIDSKINNCYVALSHNRLIINGEKGNGTQPFETNDYFLVVNGEFYQHKEIAKKENFHLLTESDSEILIHLYKKYGVECLKFLEGEFSFALYDKIKNLWFCARDRFGIRPFHYYLFDQKFIASSEAKGIMPFLEKIEIDQEALAFSQYYQYLPTNSSLFDKIKQLPAASYLLIKNKSKYNRPEIVIQNYWNINKNQQVFKEQTLENLLLNAINKRTENINNNQHNKTCVHLSGGLDSSTIAFYAKEKGVEEAFTIKFNSQYINNNLYDESEIAKITAKKLGLKLNIIEINEEDIINNFEKSVYFSEGLAINGHFPAKYILSKKIKEQGFNIALMGEGSDEIFMGYSHLKNDFLLSNKNKNVNQLTNFEKQYLKGYQLEDGNGTLPTLYDFSWLKAKANMGYKFKEFWNEDFKNIVLSKNTQNILLNIAKVNKFNEISLLKQSSLIWQKLCLSNYILKTLDDGLGMANAVESRLAFLDKDLVEYVFNLPDDIYFGDMEKILLRNLMKNKLPKEVIYKTKQSFMSPPLTLALTNDKLKNKIKDIVLNDFFIKNNLFNIKKIEKYLDLNPTNLSEPVLVTLMSISSLYNNFKL